MAGGPHCTPRGMTLYSVMGVTSCDRAGQLLCKATAQNAWVKVSGNVVEIHTLSLYWNIFSQLTYGC